MLGGQGGHWHLGLGVWIWDSELLENNPRGDPYLLFRGAARRRSLMNRCNLGRGCRQMRGAIREVARNLSTSSRSVTRDGVLVQGMVRGQGHEGKRANRSRNAGIDLPQVL